MANVQNITTDPVVLARKRADAAPDNSRAYDKAWSALVSAIATTPEGLQVKIAALQSMLCDSIDGQTLHDFVTLRETMHKSVDAIAADGWSRLAA